MLFKSNHINKAVSAAMLVMLLFIHSIKLLHSHEVSNNKQTTAIVKSSADCSICSYQLSKDASDVVTFSFDDYKPARQEFNSSLLSFHRLFFHTAFENRGPPASFWII